MRLDLRRMPMNELTQLLKDIAHELQSRGRGGQGGDRGGDRGGQPSGNYGRTGYGQPAYGAPGQAGGYGNVSRFGGGGGGGGGNYPPRGGGGGGGQSGGFRRHSGGRRQDYRQQPPMRQPVEPSAPIDDRPSDRPEPGNEA
ncbi:MAG: hypothetical protein KJ579_11105 [Verrucomicrobia bacterium]|nr:hypothetical protein [Verrucomicrobiota bacterium]